MSGAAGTVRALYAAFNRGDLGAARELLDPDVVWIAPPRYFVPEARGRTESRERVLALMARYPEYWTRAESAVDEIHEAPGGVVLVLGRLVAVSRATGRAVQSPFANVWRVRDGRLVEHRSYSDTALVAEAIGAQERRRAGSSAAPSSGCRSGSPPDHTASGAGGG